jgi:cysteinyl-tRNA synthetase
MDLKLYDTLTREKRVFKPLDPANVRMYVCGPTVYDFAHIGNARPVIVFDVLFRLLRHLFGADHVTYVRNITDVDDKINARAAEEYPALPLNEAIRKVTEQTDKQFHDDVAALGCLPPTVEPRATEHIAEMRTLIERLVKSGNAYVAEENVLFSVPSMSRPISGTRLISYCGSRQNPVNRRGRPPRGSRRLAVPAGTSNARRCRGSISARCSTSTAAASISSSRTTRTKSPNRVAPSIRR